MDPRAQQLIDELSAMPVGHNLDFNHWRGRFIALFGERLDLNSRETLLASYAKMLDFVERSLGSQGIDTAAFVAARTADWRTLCLQEALLRSDTDLAAPDDVHDIVQREIAAGRMQESEFSELAAASANVLGSRPQPVQKRGFLSRLFG